jgi:AcrR family transcriptional regulator
MAHDTREKILEAATRLFAASDSRGASLRAIAREAGVNSALIHYHFGGRESLFEAAVLNALAPVQSRRQTMIEAFRDEQSGPPPARDLARLFVEPLLPSDAELPRNAKVPSDAEDPKRQATELRLLARAFNEHRGLVQDLTLKHFGELMYALGDLLGEVLPELPTDVKHRRMRFCVQAALETLSGKEMEAARAEGPEARDALVLELIDFLAGGLEAPRPTTPR